MRRIFCIARRRLSYSRKISFGVDGEWHFIYTGDRDRHPGFERAKLFELFSPFERRWRQGDEARKRCAAERIDADVVEDRAGAVRRARAREVERAAQRSVRVPGDDG